MFLKSVFRGINTVNTVLRIRAEREWKGMMLADLANYSLNSVRIQELTCILYILCYRFLFSILSIFIFFSLG